MNLPNLWVKDENLRLDIKYLKQDIFELIYNDNGDETDMDIVVRISNWISDIEERFAKLEQELENERKTVSNMRKQWQIAFGKEYDTKTNPDG